MEVNKSSNTFTIKPPWDLVIVITFDVLFAYLIASPLMRAQVDAYRLGDGGRRASARVFNSGNQTTISYFLYELNSLSYQYAAIDPDDGQLRKYSNTQFVSLETLEHLNYGDMITITYLPSDPSISRLSGINTDDSDLAIDLICLSLTVPITGGVWVRRKWSERRSAKNKNFHVNGKDDQRRIWL